ncbi:Y-family DNA polymerase [Vagococcus bubulae]|uniref:Excinuclease ABC subunit A n=1 Tax=Vagococcus bubulae TaxID=1977868 RepID=A0A429ZQI4_9ENTE|nr:Y-family DNA polymerase [Vagococcus bubulae]RST95980.1 excinuclease ABC subunit A [Vagococcus bubulae]
MSYNHAQFFDYSKEKQEDMLCVDMKSFYASVECVERGLDPLTTLLVVMSGSDSPGGLALATSPRAKTELGISNVSRRFEIPNHPELVIVPPRMNLYIKKNIQINELFKQYVADEDILIYSIDETFIRVSQSKKLFHMTAYDFAQQFKQEIYHEFGLHCTIGIGDNMLLSKLALDNEAKNNSDMIAQWRYTDVPKTVWNIQQLTDFWGINRAMEKRLNELGIYTVYDLAHYDFFHIKQPLGVMGQQLVAHAWGIDRSDMTNTYQPVSKSIGNSQILKKDYTKLSEIKIVIKEVAEQVATRLRARKYQTECVSLSIGYSRYSEQIGFSRQLKISPTDSSKELVAYCLQLFDTYYTGEPVRKLSVNYSNLVPNQAVQLNLFEEPETTIQDRLLDQTIDVIRRGFGFDAIIHASSLLEGATAIERSHLVGGHAGGMDGLT